MPANDQIQTLTDFLHAQLPLSEGEKAFLESHLRTLTFKKGELILKPGELSKAFYFNQRGLVRMFYQKKGSDTTTFFYKEGHFISSYESFIHGSPSPHGLQALENSHLVEIGKEAAAQLLAYSPKFEVLARIAMEQELIISHKIIANLLTLKAEDRYGQLLRDMPDLFQRIPQHYLASYIGVKPESLSRIKKRSMERNDNQSQ